MLLLRRFTNNAQNKTTAQRTKYFRTIFSKLNAIKRPVHNVCSPLYSYWHQLHKAVDTSWLQFSDLLSENLYLVTTVLLHFK